MKFSYKVFENDDTLLAISDTAIVGKKFKEGKLILEITEGFYSEKFCDEKGAIELIKKATIVNAVGREIIELMKREDMIDGSNVLWIGGIPHAQIIVIK